MTTKEAAALLGITVQSVARLIRKELINAHWNAYARRFEIEAAEVERYQKERRGVGKPKKPNVETPGTTADGAAAPGFPSSRHE